MSSFYRPEIDGLRAVAIVPVVLFHADATLLKGGYLGVDVFFVISGFLITSLLLGEIQRGEFSLIRFYERRGRRILPALFFVMFLCIPASWVLMYPTQFHSFSSSLVAVSGFASNFLFWFQDGYFSPAADEKPLLHTWSLAVEEQFYLIFPIILLSILRFFEKRLLVILGLLALVSFSAAQWGWHYKPSSTFYLAHARAWELLSGSACAVLSIKSKTQFSLTTRNLFSAAGIPLVGSTVAFFDENTLQPFVVFFGPVLGTCLILYFGTSGTFVNLLLSTRPFVGIGLISYSAYLWHQPLFAFERLRNADEPALAVMLFLAAISFAVAFFSWRFVEKPFRGKGVISTTNAVWTFLISISVVLSIGLAGIVTNGFKSYYVANRLSGSEVHLFDLVQAHTGGETKMFDDGACRFWSKDVDEAFLRRFLKCSSGLGKGWIVLGDSHAMNIYNIIAKSGEFKFVVGVAQGGCRPHNDKPTCQYRNFKNFLREHSAAVEKVVYHQSGSYFLADPDGNVDSQKAFVKSAVFSLHSQNLLKMDSYLERIGLYAPVVWLGPFVEARIDVADLRNFRSSYQILDESILRFDLLEKEIFKFVAGESMNYDYASFHDAFAIPAGFLLAGDCITYRNKDHFSQCGEDLLASRMKEALRSGFLR